MEQNIQIERLIEPDLTDKEIAIKLLEGLMVKFKDTNLYPGTYIKNEIGRLIRRIK